jgi:hemolysin activation/secretion protein
MACSAGAVVETVDGQDSTVPEQAEPVTRFNVWEYRISGNTLLRTADIERIVYPYLGPEREFADLEGARDALMNAYADAGFPQVQVSIPPQTVDQGVVRLAVVEAKVERAWVSGGNYFSPRDIREQMPAVAAGEIINENAFREQINAVNRRNPDLKVIPVLRPGKGPGTVEVELKVKDEFPLHGGIELNNKHSADTSDTRLELSLDYGNLWQADHKLGLLAIFSPEKSDESRVLSANYLMPVGDGQDKLLGYYLNTNSNTQTVGGISVVGAGDIFGAAYISPREGSPSLFHSIMFGAEYRDMRDETEGDVPKNIKYLAFNTVWMGKVFHDEKITTDFNLKATAGFDGLVNDAEEFEQNRQDAEPGFLLVNLDLTHERPAIAESTIRLHTSAQLTGQPLIDNVQFSAGGADSVRGYFESQELRDNGVIASVEWVSPNLQHLLWRQETPGKRELFLHAFADAAWLWDEKPEADPTDPSANLVSLGVGADVKAFDEVYAEVYVARPMVSAGTVEQGDTKVHFRVGYEF